MTESPKVTMEQGPEYCVYYERDSEDILDFVPAIDADLRNTVIAVWKQEIPRKILQAISEGGLTMQELRKRIGHSNSTLHENVKKLEELQLIRTNIIYEGNKIRVLEPRFLFVTKNPKFRIAVQRFFQGLWVDSSANEKVLEFLSKHPDEYFTAEEIAAKTGLTVDKVELALTSWDSQATRALSDFMRKRPFEKKVLYKGFAE